MHLIESLADSDAAFFQFHLDKRQAIHQNRHVVAIRLRSNLLKLVDDLHFISGNILLVGDIDVLNMPIVKDKIVNVVIVNLAGFINQRISRLVQIFLHKPIPFLIGKRHIIKGLNLHPGIREQSFGSRNVLAVFIALVHQILDKLFFKIRFGLICNRWFVKFAMFGIVVKNDKMVCFCDGVILKWFTFSNRKNWFFS